MSLPPLEVTVSVHPAARNIGLRSEMGLAVAMFPPIHWNWITSTAVSHNLSCGKFSFCKTVGSKVGLCIDIQGELFHTIGLVQLLFHSKTFL